MVCKNEGPTFSRKAALSYNSQLEMFSLGTPKESQKMKKCGKRRSPNQRPNKHKKKHPKFKRKSPKVTPRLPQRYPKVTPPPPPYAGRATPAHPQSRVSAKALESRLKLFAMVCSTHFVLARRIGGLLSSNYSQFYYGGMKGPLVFGQICSPSGLGLVFHLRIPPT